MWISIPLLHNSRQPSRCISAAVGPFILLAWIGFSPDAKIFLLFQFLLFCQACSRTGSVLSLLLLPSQRGKVIKYHLCRIHDLTSFGTSPFLPRLVLPTASLACYYLLNRWLHTHSIWKVDCFRSQLYSSSWFVARMSSSTGGER